MSRSARQLPPRRSVGGGGQMSHSWDTWWLRDATEASAADVLRAPWVPDGTGRLVHEFTSEISTVDDLRRAA